MRLRRLDLSRYGLFTDHAVDFGEPVAGEPDLHVVYGPNEAGKSTALAGFLDLLFGIGQRSGYGFLHGYGAMRVAADLEIGGGTRRLVRTKKRRGSLQDESGQPVDDGAVAAALGGMDRDAYRAMFSLDDDSLEKGGEEILRSEGELGRLLFATSAGLVELGRTLDGLRGRTEEFRKGQARKTKLRGLKDELARLKQEARELDMAASAYRRLVEERDRARAAYDEEAGARAKLETERKDVERRLRGLPVLAEAERLREELAGLAGLPDVPRAWFEQIGRLVAELPGREARLDERRRRKKELDERRKALVVDARILEIEDAFVRLDDARARSVTAAKDLPQRRSQLSVFDGRIATVLRRLGREAVDDPAALAISADVAGALRDLIGRRSGVEERLKAAEDELGGAVDEARQADDAVRQAEADAGDPAAVERLGDAVKALLAENPMARVAMLVKQRAARRIARDARLARLPWWRGDVGPLARVRAPERRRLDEWGPALDRASGEAEKLEQEEVRLRAERSRLSRRMATAATSIVGDEEARSLRESRDEAWASHRERLDEESADVFETRMRDDDAATDGRVAHATELAASRRAGEDLEIKTQDLEWVAAGIARARERRQGVLDEIAAAARRMSETGAEDVPGDASLPELEEWIERRDEILAAQEEMEVLDAEIALARERAERLRERLGAATRDAGVADAPRDLEELVAAAQAAHERGLRRRAVLDAARDGNKAAMEDLRQRRRAAKRARDDDSGWRKDWTSALSRCWLRDIEPEPSGATAGGMLDDLSALESMLEQRADLAGRIAKMERDQADYAALVGALAERLGAAFEPEAAAAFDDEVRARLAKAVDGRKTRERLAGEAEEIAEEIAEIEAGLRELRAGAKEMFEAFGVESLAEVDALLRKVVRRDDVRKGLADREADLAELMGMASPEEAEAALAGADRGALEARASELGMRLDDAVGRIAELFSGLERAKADVRAVGGDDAAALVEQRRRTVVDEIEEDARAYLGTRLGILAAERALDAYRQEHRSSMLGRASEAFRTISRGAYWRLDAQAGDKGEILVGVRPGGGTKIAPQMSKGARFQLYLALRVAGHAEFVGRHGPVPFFADDILETFDDLRAEEAFRLFAGMARSGQVIYLSHHRHLCDIARDVCPGVAVHELPDPARPEAKARLGETPSASVGDPAPAG